jgi:hypothetical protein
MLLYFIVCVYVNTLCGGVMKKQKGTTLLYLTSLMGNFKAMELLILNGALVNAKNDVSVWNWLLFFLSFCCCWSSLHISFSFDWVILMIHLKTCKHTTQITLWVSSAWVRTPTCSCTRRESRSDSFLSQTRCFP